MGKDLVIQFLEKEWLRKADHQAVSEARSKYPGEYVAIHRGEMIAHHSKADMLLQIVQTQFGLAGKDVLLVKSDDTSELRIRHPRLLESCKPPSPRKQSCRQ